VSPGIQHVRRLGQGTNLRTGYIDLSKRRVSPEDIVKCEERYNKSKMVHSIMRHVAEKTNVPIESLYESIAWPLNRKFGHAIDAFKLSITLVSSPVELFLVLGLWLTE
jgi:translation initiation factor 2 alpha subunit (eIF-2alpha)